MLVSVFTSVSLSVVQGVGFRVRIRQPRERRKVREDARVVKRALGYDGVQVMRRDLAIVVVLLTATLAAAGQTTHPTTTSPMAGAADRARANVNAFRLQLVCIDQNLRQDKR